MCSVLCTYVLCGVVWCGVVWCGVVWCGVVWCGVVWCGVVWCGVVWCGVVWCGVVWCGVVWCGVVWCGVVWCGVVWCGVVWCGVVWCGVVWYAQSPSPQPQNTKHLCTAACSSRHSNRILLRSALPELLLLLFLRFDEAFLEELLVVLGFEVLMDRRAEVLRPGDDGLRPGDVRSLGDTFWLWEVVLVIDALRPGLLPRELVLPLRGFAPALLDLDFMGLGESVAIARRRGKTIVGTPQKCLPANDSNTGQQEQSQHEGTHLGVQWTWVCEVGRGHNGSGLLLRN